MTIKNDIGLIGDFLGTIPAMLYLVEKHNVVYVKYNEEIKELFDMIKTSALLTSTVEVEKYDYEFDLTKAFEIAGQKNLHMTQAHFAVLGLPIPEAPIKPSIRIDISSTYNNVDYIIAPFSRSLPPEQRWQDHKWQQLVDEMPDKQFLVMGAVGDNRDIIHPKTLNLSTGAFGYKWNYIMRLMKQATKGVISHVSGVSHVCYTIGAKNYLLTNQGGAWGNNPDAIKITKNIHDISVDDMIKFLTDDTIK